MQQQRFFGKIVAFLLPRYIHDKVDCAGYRFGPFQIGSGSKLGIVITMEQVSANRKLFKELRIGNLCDVGITVSFTVTNGIVVHCLL